MEAFVKWLIRVLAESRRVALLIGALVGALLGALSEPLGAVGLVPLKSCVSSSNEPTPLP